MKLLVSLILCLWLYCASAQVSDDFSDGDFSSNPAWNGTGSNFQVNSSKQLQLNAVGAGESYLSIQDSLFGDVQWDFYVRLAFSPSGSNFMRFYLVSNKADLSGSLNGYYIQVGEAGSQDGVDLFRQDSLTHKLLLNGASGRAAKSNNTLRIRVKRDNIGNWEVYTDSVGGTNYVPEGQVKDDTYTQKFYTGVYAKYTSSNSTRVYWDDISVSEIVVDKTPPHPLFVTTVDSATIEVQFSEPLDSITALDLANYSVLSVGNPVTTTQNFTDKSKVRLVFAKAFETRKKHTLEIQGVKDLAGNAMPVAAQLQFIYYEAMKGDLVINEILADPTPSAGLPEEEFIELYNTSSFPVVITGWTLSDGSSTATLPKDTILPGSYRILTADAAAFDTFSGIIELKSLPSLNNSGDNLLLRNASGYLIDEVRFSDDWYRDGAKKSGGYTLERINPAEYCKGGENWIASNDISGGTPGTVNSVYSNIPDTLAPRLNTFVVADSAHIHLAFSEPLDTLAVLTATFRLNGNIINPAIVLQPDNKNLKLTIPGGFASGQTNTFSISKIADCLQNSDSASFHFTYIKPIPASRFDVIINEVMSDPKAPNIPVRYVELYNRSNKPILFKDWHFEDAASSATLPPYLLMPDSFIVLCAANDSSKLRTFCTNFIALNAFPTLNVTGDSLFLYDAKGALVHFLAYADEWHADDVKKQGGWSLELKDPDNVCNPEGSWTSSVHGSGGTPGQGNSVKTQVKDKTVPGLLKVIPADSISLTLYFSEPLDSIMAANTAMYRLTDNSITVSKAEPLFPDFRKLSLSLSAPLTHGKIYGLSAEGIPDCSVNLSEGKVISFGLPEKPDSFDIVFNELLFNPETGGPDFVELFNRSEKVIDLQDLLIATADEENILREPEEISREGYLLLPESYCVLTTDKDLLNELYYVPSSQFVIEVSNLPGMPDDEGTVVLARKDGVRIDQVSYSEDWHFSLLTDKEGVSLEKLNPSLPSQEKSSWHSASSTVGYATPTYINSQYQALSNAVTKNPFSLDPPVFSPDGDGYQDVLNILYQFDNPGHVATIEIFDREGRIVRTLENNQLLGTSGYLNWDGLTDKGEKARIGVYILLITTYTPAGQTESYKMTATLVGRF